MNKRCLLLVIVALSTFNLIFIVGEIITPRSMDMWLFPELGVAVVQDAYTIRAPALESPFGMIGDIPGGYTPYLGSPYLDVDAEEIQQWIIRENSLQLDRAHIDITMIIVAVILIAIPLFTLLVLGRRSYGVSKTL